MALSIPPRPLALMTASHLPPPARRNERAINKFIDKVFETKRFVGREEEAAPPAPAAPVADLSTPPPPAAPVAVALQAPVVSSAGSWVAFGDDTPAPTPAAQAQASPAPPADPFAAAMATPPAPAAVAVPADPFAISAPVAAVELAQPAASSAAQATDWVAFDTPGPQPGPAAEPAPAVKEEEPGRKELPLDLFTMEEPASTSAPPAPFQQQQQARAAQAFAQFGNTPGLAAAMTAQPQHPPPPQQPAAFVGMPGHFAPQEHQNHFGTLSPGNMGGVGMMGSAGMPGQYPPPQQQMQPQQQLGGVSPQTMGAGLGMGMGMPGAATNAAQGFGMGTGAGQFQQPQPVQQQQQQYGASPMGMGAFQQPAANQGGSARRFSSGNPFA